MSALRRILPITLALAVAAGPVASAAIAGPDGSVRCGSHVELVQKMRHVYWYALLTVRNRRPHAATVSGRWKVRGFDDTTTLHQHVALGADDSRRTLVLVQKRHVNHRPTVEVVSCR
jgi:hypothetical protein